MVGALKDYGILNQTPLRQTSRFLFLQSRLLAHPASELRSSLLSTTEAVAAPSVPRFTIAAGTSSSAASFIPGPLPALPSVPTASAPTRPSSSFLPTSSAPPTRPRPQARRRSSLPARPPSSTPAAPLRPLPQPQVVPPRRVKVLPFVPKNLWTLFQDVCRPIFADLERAASCNNAPQLERLLKELLEVPAHTLAVRRGGRRAESVLASQLRAVSVRRQQLSLLPHAPPALIA